MLILEEKGREGKERSIMRERNEDSPTQQPRHAGHWPGLFKNDFAWTSRNGKC